MLGAAPEIFLRKGLRAPRVAPINDVRPGGPPPGRLAVAAK